MNVYDRQINNVLRQIKAKGQTVTWVSKSDSQGGDPWNPSPGASSETEIDILFLPTSVSNQQLMRYLAGTEVSVGSLIGYMGLTEFEPKIEDSVKRPNFYTGEDETLFIKSLNTLAPNGKPILTTIEFET